METKHIYLTTKDRIRPGDERFVDSNWLPVLHQSINMRVTKFEAQLRWLRRPIKENKA